MKKAAPVSKALVVAADDSRLREMAPQIEAQLERARPALHEIAIFWGMVKLFQEEAARVSLYAYKDTQKREGKPSKDTDLKVLFSKYAPAINYDTAFRFYCVGEHIAETFRLQLPETLLRKIDLPRLAVSKPEALAKVDRRLPKKQKDLFAHANGASQRSWLNEFRQSRGRGGNQYERGGDKGKRRQTPHAERVAIERGHCIAIGTAADLALRGQLFRHLNNAELDFLLSTLEKTAVALRLWKNKPKGERGEILRAELAASLKNAAKKK